jgi:hypothetical protein
MKFSKPVIAMAVLAVLPLAAIAGDKDKSSARMGTSAQFDKLDTNRDGRISQTEASSDTKIVFTTADKNADGYLDNSEYPASDMSRETMPSSSDPATDADKPR